MVTYEIRLLELRSRDAHMNITRFFMYRYDNGMWWDSEGNETGSDAGCARQVYGKVKERENMIDKTLTIRFVLQSDDRSIKYKITDSKLALMTVTVRHAFSEHLFLKFTDFPNGQHCPNLFSLFSLPFFSSFHQTYLGFVELFSLTEAVTFSFFGAVFRINKSVCLD